MLTPKEIEEILKRHPFLRPPKQIFILSAPIVYPELRAIIYGINPAGRRDVVILSSMAGEKTLLHETLHRMGIGEIIADRLARRLMEFRKRFRPIIRKNIKYDVRTMSSKEMEKYGLAGYEYVDGYVRKELKIKLLKLKEVSYRV